MPPTTPPAIAPAFALVLVPLMVSGKLDGKLDGNVTVPKLMVGISFGALAEIVGLGLVVPEVLAVLSGWAWELGGRPELACRASDLLSIS